MSEKPVYDSIEKLIELVRKIYQPKFEKGLERKKEAEKLKNQSPKKQP